MDATSDQSAVKKTKKKTLLFKEKDQKLKNFKQGQEGQASTETAEQKGQQGAAVMVGKMMS